VAPTLDGLLGFTGAVFVLQPGGAGTPELSLAAALVAVVAGTVFGTLAVAASGVPGASTGAPAMALLRGLFGTRLSYLPTVLNVLQCLGWATFELVTIAAASRTVAPGIPRWVDVVAAGAVTTLLCVRPLGAVRVLRRYVTTVVALILAYLFMQIHVTPSPLWAEAAGRGFGRPPTQPSRWRSPSSPWHRTTPATLCFRRHPDRLHRRPGRLLRAGLLTLVTVARNPNEIYSAFIAVPAGTLAFAVLAVRELDQSFANVYSSATSTQTSHPTLTAERWQSPSGWSRP